MRRRHLISTMTLAMAYGPVEAADIAENRPDREAIATRLPEVTVSAEPPSTVPQVSTSATKTETPLRDIPQSVRVITRELIEEKGALRSKDVLQQASGVFLQQGEGARDDFNIRGFTALRDVYKDGVRDDLVQQFRDLANIERIEVIKGPSSALFGRGSSGGLINYVTKKPVAESRYAVEQKIGRYDLLRTELDLGGPLAGEEWVYRFDGAYEQTNSFRDFVSSERFFAAPSVAWRPSEDIDLRLQLSYLEDDRTPDRGIPGIGSRPAKVKRRTFYGEAFDFQDTQVYDAGLYAEWRLSERWTFRNAFRAAYTDVTQLGTRNLSVTNGRTLRRGFVEFSIPQENYFNQTDLIYKTSLGPTEHTLLLGTEFGYQKRDFLNKIAAAPSIDIFDPAHSARAPVFTARPTIDASFSAFTFGGYAQDQIAFGEHWKALIGLRYDHFDQAQDDHRTGTRLSRVDDELSPRGGLVFQPAEWASFYGHISQSFQPAGDSLLFPDKVRTLEPESSTLYEVGAKADLAERLSATLALFEIEKDNIATNEPGNTGFKIQVGEQRHRGVELDLTAELLPRWKLYGSYAFIDAEITKSRTFAVGNRPANVPEHSGSLWSSYEFGNGFGFGGGLVMVGDRFAFDDDQVVLPGYVRADASVFYRQKHFEVALNLNNLLDKAYFESASSNTQISPGAPFTALATLKALF